MSRTLLVICMLACAIILGVVAWLILLPGVPMHKGRPLTAWVPVTLLLEPPSENDCLL